MLAQAIEDENFEELVDPRLDNNYVDREMFRMIEAAAACVRHSAVKRPRMSQVSIFISYIKVPTKWKKTSHINISQLRGKQAKMKCIVLITGGESSRLFR